MGDFEYYSELAVFLESALGQEFVKRLVTKREMHKEKKANMANRCTDSIMFEQMRENFLKESVFIKAYEEILSDIADLGAIKSLVKELKEKAIRG
jgi:phosphoglucomutase